MFDTPLSARQIWAARILTGLSVAFLLFDAAVKVLKLVPAVEGTTALGYPPADVAVIGLLELMCIVVYLVPRTRLVGAILLTGFLGGAVASQVRVGNPLFSHVLFPTYVAAMVWGGLVLAEAPLGQLRHIRLRARA